MFFPLLHDWDFKVGTIERTRNGGMPVFERRESSDADKESRGFADDVLGIFVFSLPSRNIDWLLGIWYL
jgi:hypothetical protein